MRVYDADAVDDVVGHGRVVVWQTTCIAGAPDREIGMIFRYDGSLHVTRLLVKSGVGMRREGPEPVSCRALRSIVRRAEVHVVPESVAAERVDVPDYVRSGTLAESATVSA